MVAPHKLTLNVAISANVTTEVIDARNLTDLGVFLPAALTSTTISFQVSHDGTTFEDLYDTANTLVSQTVAQGRSYPLKSELKAWPYFKIKMGTNEAAARVLILVGKG